MGRITKLLLVAVLCCNVAHSTNTHISNYVFEHIQANKTLIFRDFLMKNAMINVDCAYILGSLLTASGQQKLANYYIDIAASRGHSPAINAVGDRYYALHNHREALIHYKMAAQKGYGPSQFNIGVIYMKHLHNKKLAVYWLTKASNNTMDFCEHMRNSAKNLINANYGST